MDFVINGRNWQLQLVPPTFPMLLAPSGEFTLGCCNVSNQTIYIAQGLDWNKFQKVLGHEITHAAMFSYNVELTYDQEELIADIISTYGSEIVAVTNRVFRKIKGKSFY